LNVQAWVRVWDNPSALVASLVLAFSTSVVALAVVIGWLENQPQTRDKYMVVLSAAALGLPAILLGLGQYRAFLQTGFIGTAFGLFLAHLIPVTAYMFIVLVGPYRSFDPRWRASASGLLAGFPRFFLAIKTPLLKAPLLAASAIGFAVSFGQYVPAQLIAAGRYSTLPMEAVTLTSGTNRPLTAAFTLLLMVPPLLAFIAAAHFSKPRWSAA
jgi:putative thiamine transport system permease protein